MASEDPVGQEEYFQTPNRYSDVTGCVDLHPSLDYFPSIRLLRESLYLASSGKFLRLLTSVKPHF